MMESKIMKSSSDMTNDRTMGPGARVGLATMTRVRCSTPKGLTAVRRALGKSGRVRADAPCKVVERA